MSIIFVAFIEGLEVLNCLLNFWGNVIMWDHSQLWDVSPSLSYMVIFELDSFFYQTGSAKEFFESIHLFRFIVVGIESISC